MVAREVEQICGRDPDRIRDQRLASVRCLRRCDGRLQQRAIADAWTTSVCSDDFGVYRQHGRGVEMDERALGARRL